MALADWVGGIMRGITIAILMGVYALWQTAYIRDSYFTSNKDGIKGSECAVVKNDDNDNHTTSPAYGLAVEDAIMFVEGTQPSGSTQAQSNTRGAFY